MHKDNLMHFSNWDQKIYAFYFFFSFFNKVWRKK